MAGDSLPVGSHTLSPLHQIGINRMTYQKTVRARMKTSPLNREDPIFKIQQVAFRKNQSIAHDRRRRHKGPDQ